jgi:hypothetical protein
MLLSLFDPRVDAENRYKERSLVGLIFVQGVLNTRDVVFRFVFVYGFNFCFGFVVVCSFGVLPGKTLLILSFWCDGGDGPERERKVGSRKMLLLTALQHGHPFLNLCQGLKRVVPCRKCRKLTAELLRISALVSAVFRERERICRTEQ